MFSTQTKGPLSLSALFFLLLALVNFAFAVPLPESLETTNTTVIKRGERGYDPKKDPLYGKPITQPEYEQYLRTYYPQTDRYLLYSGNSIGQLRAWQEKNPGYYGYDDFYNAEKSTTQPKAHVSEHFYKAFPKELERGDDGDASSRAIGTQARNRVRVFGASDYQSPAASESWYTSQEAPKLKDSAAAGQLKDGVYHMKKDTLGENDYYARQQYSSSSKSMEWKYEKGYDASYDNTYMKTKGKYYDQCKRDAAGACDMPTKNDPNAKDPTAAPAKPATAQPATDNPVYGDPAQQTKPGGAPESSTGESPVGKPGSTTTTTTEPVNDPIHGPTIIEDPIHI